MDISAGAMGLGNGRLASFGSLFINNEGGMHHYLDAFK